jgi:phosphotransferase system  glucose/maltose/N-acetylglucosamine-specific IIC component
MQQVNLYQILPGVRSSVLIPCLAAIGFTLLMLFAAKSQQYKALGKLTTLPALFGISEPLVFGTPSYLISDLLSLSYL